MRFYVDDDAETLVRWFFVPDGTPPLPFSTRFASGNWASQKLSWPGVGEVLDAERVYDKGTPPAGLKANHFCGPQAYFESGAPIGAPALDIDYRGVPWCCIAHAGGVVLGGSGFVRGGVKVGGAGTMQYARTITGSGGVILGGAATLQYGSIVFGSGGSIFLGNPLLQYGWTIFPVGGGGGGGGAQLLQGFRVQGQGGGGGGGGAQLLQGFRVQGQGGGQGGGLGQLLNGYRRTGSGGGQGGGLGQLLNGYRRTGSGGGQGGGLGQLLNGYRRTGSGGPEFKGGATMLAGYRLSGSGGIKGGGAATLFVGTREYTQSTNTDTTCDSGTATSKDLATAVGSSTSVSRSNLTTSFVETLVFDVAISPAQGTWNCSLNVSAMSNASQEYKFRMQAINSSCAAIGSSSYSSTFTTTGVRTLSGSVTWSGTANRVRISVETRATVVNVALKTITITNDSTSFLISAR